MGYACICICVVFYIRSSERKRTSFVHYDVWRPGVWQAVWIDKNSQVSRKITLKPARVFFKNPIVRTVWRFDGVPSSTACFFRLSKPHKEQERPD